MLEISSPLRLIKMVECGWLSERLQPYVENEKVVDPSDMASLKWNIWVPLEAYLNLYHHAPILYMWHIGRMGSIWGTHFQGTQSHCSLWKSELVMFDRTMRTRKRWLFQGVYTKIYIGGSYYLKSPFFVWQFTQGSRHAQKPLFFQGV